MTEIAGDNADQASYWTSPAGEKWVRFQREIDELFLLITGRLLERAAPAPGEKVLDVGCGTGATSMALADAVGPTGAVTGIDISDLVLSHANTRKVAGQHDHITFLVADAQTHGFQAAHYDLLTSRFGVMFFADPVAAFTNMGRALRPGGRAAFVTWAEMAGNPWFTIPRDAAVGVLGPVEPAPPRAPGPFAFTEIEYVEEILRNAGFVDIEGTEEGVDLFSPRPLEEVAALASNLGTAARIVKEYDGTADHVTQITERVAAALAPFVEADGVRVPARVNVFRATRSSR